MCDEWFVRAIESSRSVQVLSSDNQDENVATIKVRTRGRDSASAKTMVASWMRSKDGGGRVFGGVEVG